MPFLLPYINYNLTCSVTVIEILRLTQFDISYMRIKQVEIYIENEILRGCFIITLSVHVFVCVVYVSLLLSYSTKLVRLSYLLYDGGKYLFQLTCKLESGILFVFVFSFFMYNLRGIYSICQWVTYETTRISLFSFWDYILYFHLLRMSCFAIKWSTCVLYIH